MAVKSGVPDLGPASNGTIPRELLMQTKFSERAPIL